MTLAAQHSAVVALQQSDVMRRLLGTVEWLTGEHVYGRRVLTTHPDGPAASVAPAKDSNGLVGVSLGDALSEERLFELSRPFAEDLFRRVAACSKDARVVVEQTPEHVRVTDEILRILPDAVFVHVIRDPRAVFASHKRAARSWGHPAHFIGDPIKVAREWCEEVQLGRNTKKHDGRYLELRYEDLKSNGETELARLFDFLGLETDEAFRRAALEACGIERLRAADLAPRGFFGRGEVDSWRAELSKGEIRAIEHLCWELMAELGYETTSAAPSTRPDAPLRLRCRMSSERLRERVYGLGAASRRGLCGWAWRASCASPPVSAAG